MTSASKEDKENGHWVSYENFLSPGQNCYTWGQFRFSSEKRMKHPQVQNQIWLIFGKRFSRHVAS